MRAAGCRSVCSVSPEDYNTAPMGGIHIQLSTLLQRRMAQSFRSLRRRGHNCPINETVLPNNLGTAFGEQAQGSRIDTVFDLQHPHG